MLLILSAACAVLNASTAYIDARWAAPPLPLPLTRDPRSVCVPSPARPPRSNEDPPAALARSVLVGSFLLFAGCVATGLILLVSFCVAMWRGAQVRRRRRRRAGAPQLLLHPLPLLARCSVRSSSF